MALTLSDEVLRDLKMDERTARIEIACRLFEAEKLQLWPAAKLAGLNRIDMENELDLRGIALYRVTPEYWAQEKRTLAGLETPSESGGKPA